MNLLTAIVAGAGVALIVWTAHAEQIEVSGHDILSIGDHGKILNNTTYACKMPSDPTAYRRLLQMNARQIAAGEPVKASPDGECWPLVAGTEVELVRTAGSYPDVVCVRVLGEQSCAWTFRLGIEPVATYDREQAETKSILDHFNEVFDRTHPECKDYRTNPNLPEYCY
jgi:hypothetical protein